MNYEEGIILQIFIKSQIEALMKNIKKGIRTNQSQNKWLWWVGISWEDFIVGWIRGSCWWPSNMLHEAFTKSGKCVIIVSGLHYSIKGCSHFIISNVQHSSTLNPKHIKSWEINLQACLELHRLKLWSNTIKDHCT